MNQLKHLTTRREEVSITPEMLSTQTGISLNRIEGIENGTVTPTANEIGRLALALNCTVSFLLGLKTQPHEDLLPEELTEDEKLFLEAMRDPETRFKLDKVVELDKRAVELLQTKAMESRVQRILLPIRKQLMFPAMLIPNTVIAILWAIYTIVLLVISFIALAAFGMPLSLNLPMIGFALLATILGFEAARLTQRAVIPTALHNEFPIE